MRFLLTFSIICFYSAISIAQNAIGASFGARFFPLQEHGTYDYHGYNVTLTPAPEYATTIFLEHQTRSGNGVLHVGLNSYTAVMDFKKMTSQSWGEAGVNGADGFYNTFTQRGRYTYTFVGLEFGANFYKHSGSGNFSFVQGFLASVNSLADQKTYNKEYLSAYHSYSNIFSGPNAGTYSSDTTIRTSNVDDLKIAPFNIKAEYQIGFSYKANGNLFRLTATFGASTQSRILKDPNDQGFNLYLCPRFSYARILEKKKK